MCVKKYSHESVHVSLLAMLSLRQSFYSNKSPQWRAKVISDLAMSKHALQSIQKTNHYCYTEQQPEARHSQSDVYIQQTNQKTHFYVLQFFPIANTSFCKLGWF